MARNNGIKGEAKNRVDRLDEMGFFDMARRMALAAIGAAALSMDEIEAFIDRLVERGELAEKDARRLMDEVMEKRARGTRQEGGSVERRLDRRMEELLHRMNVPSKADMDELSKKINTLSRKVDELKKSQ